MNPHNIHLREQGEELQSIQRRKRFKEIEDAKIQENTKNDRKNESQFFGRKDKEKEEFFQGRNQDIFRDFSFLQTSQYKDTLYSSKRAEVRNTRLTNDLNEKKSHWLCEYRMNVRFINAYSRRLKEELVPIQTVDKGKRTLKYKAVNTEENIVLKLPSL